MLEGPDLVAAALEAGVGIEAVYFEAAAATPARAACAAVLAAAASRGVRLIELDQGVLARVADAVTPQPVLAVAALPDTGLATVPAHGFVLVLHDVRDPGNLGTAVRAADASGAAAVVVSGQSVDVFNPKTLRATAGSAFHLPVAVAGSLAEVVAVLHGTGRDVLGAVVRGGEPLWSAPITAQAAVVVGGEAAGLGADEQAGLDGAVTIEMAGRAESLNVGVAAALVCFEALRRRRGPLEGSPPPR
ncbi:MAG TPA: RNA methyltransferase [Acidimicrobiales bacterium]|nr:RNA methyltransferase [Acidimicrobiales bacterium]